ncbi:hypothetical protein [Mucilaginibacter lacusdianchii]|uniref:hypothetical protein n=1 Tax=Mucilaginibacter lacusdianchii TaxID=2684211 RepID=UPI00131CAA40|nr:hypothetical protein [Mucilaginibacter sp. JXJ CY 39]
MTTIERLLKIKGPLISSELAQLLAKSGDMSINTASQNISRAKEVLRIKGFFKSNQSLIYLQEHADEDLVYPILAKLMYEHGLKYWYTLNALQLHQGIISQQYLTSYTNYPVIPLKGHLPFKIVMQKFVSQNIVIFNGDDYILSPKLQAGPRNGMMNKALETVKAYVLDSFHSITKNTGLISYNSGELFAEYGKFNWCFKGLSPVIGLRNNENNFGYLLADILLGVPIYKQDVLFFIAKLEHIKSFKKAPRLLPFLIVDDMDKEALELLKQKGIIVGFIGELFGAKYAETLKELLTILNNAAASLKADPEKYLDLIKQLKVYNEGLLGNIRGTLFEYAVGHIHVIDCQNMEIGREILDESGTKHEMDVLAVYSDRIVIAECKGKKSQVEEDDVEDWLKRAIPAFRAWVEKQEIYKKKRLEFEYWSTGGFDADATDVLDDAVSTYRKNKISYFGPKEIRQKVKDMGNKKLKEALDNYFLKPAV